MLLLWGKDSEYPQHHISDEAWLMQMDAESVTWKKVYACPTIMPGKKVILSIVVTGI